MKHLLRMIVAVCVVSFAFPLVAAAAPAPDFESPVMGGQTFKLADYKGTKGLVLAFAQTACSTCRMELKFLNDYVGKSDNYEILMVNVDAIGGTERWNTIIKKYMEQQGLTMRVLIDPKMTVARMFKVRATPATVVIDKDGNILESITGYTAEDNGKIEALIKKIQ